MNEPGIAPSGRKFESEEDELAFYSKLEHEWVATDVDVLMAGSAINQKADEAHMPETAVAYYILDQISKVCELRKAKLKEPLLRWTKTFGIATSKGGQEILFGENRMVRERRINHQLEPKDIAEVLRRRGVSMSEATSPVLKVDAIKLARLVAQGRITQEDVESAKSTHWGLHFEASPLLARLVLRATGALGKELRDRMARGREDRRAAKEARPREDE
jgi:hypothetical protein